MAFCQSSGNCANWVSVGLVSHTAARPRIMELTRGFFSGSVMTIGMAAKWLVSAPSLIVSLARICRSATASTGAQPLKTPAVFFTGAEISGTLSHQ
jgi:hypothetical protein